MGYKSVIGCGKSGYDTIVLSSTNGGNAWTQYAPVGGLIGTPAAASASPVITQALGALNCHSPHTSSNMGLMISQSTNLSANINHQLYANGVVGNQIVTILSYANNNNANYAVGAKISDATHTDAISGGETLSLAQSWTGTGNTGQVIYTGVFWKADQPGGACVPWSCNQNGATLASINTYAPKWLAVTGYSAAFNSASVGSAQNCMPSAGRWSNIQINIAQAQTGTGAQNQSIQSCVSPTFLTGTTPTFGNQVLATPDNLGAGIQDDATGTDAVPAGDYINYQLSGNGVVQTYWSAFGSTWTSAAPNVTPWMAGSGPVAFTASGTQSSELGYTIIRTGPFTFGQGPSENSCQMPIGGSFSGMNVSVTTTTTINPQPNFQSAPNLQAGNQIGTFPTSPGNVADSTHSDAMPAGEIFTGAFNNVTASFLLASQAVAFMTPGHTDNLSLLGTG